MDTRVLIADDDQGMRLLLRKAIDKIEGFEVIGEAADGESALQLVESLNPDVIFMDVEMPLLSGVECAKKVIDFNPKIKIIFATAHEEYMPEAFELYAFDYMVKPFKTARIAQTLNKIKQLNISEAGIHSNHGVSSDEKVLGKLIIRNKESINLIDEEDIIFVQREERTTAIYTSTERYITSEGLSELEERLDRSNFFRSHKSYIINLNMISKIYPYGRWTYLVKLKKTDKDALLTHERYEDLQKLFK